MKVTIFNGSPRREGNTCAAVSRFARELIGRGAEVEIVYLFKLNILGCNHCDRCQHERLPRRCSIDDDMLELYPKYLAADIVVFASPIYMWQITPCTQAFLTRLQCLCQSSDFSYNEEKGKKLAVALTMGDGSDNADLAVEELKRFCQYFSADYRGAMLIPFAKKAEIDNGQHDAEITEFADRVLSRVSCYLN